MRIGPREQVILIAMLMGITVCDGLVTMWTYRRRSA
jgi:hypothetical protein